MLSVPLPPSGGQFCVVPVTATVPPFGQLSVWVTLPQTAPATARLSTSLASE